MSDPNVTPLTTFTGRHGSKVTLRADYGGLAIRGDAVLEGEEADAFITVAIAVLGEARRREAERLRDEEAGR